MNHSREIADYLSRSVHKIVFGALQISLKNPKEFAFIAKYTIRSRRAKRIRMQYEKGGTHIPAFLIASISTQCNLYCTGCYARANQSCSDDLNASQLSVSAWDRVFTQAEELGVSFVLIGGGEPLTRRDVIACAAMHKKMIFPVFTNGTMIDEDYLALLDKNRNMVPILSIEGNADQTDGRRGVGVYATLMDVMSRLKKRSIFFGVSVTFTTGNLSIITEDSFVESLYSQGCKVVFFIEYVPVSLESRHLAPGDAERAILEERQSDLRAKYPKMIFLSFPGDEKHTGGCLAAGRGFFHINANGGAEPCPFSPYSDSSVKDHTLLEILDSELFRKISESGMLIGEHSGGCLLFEKEADVISMLSSSPNNEDASD